MTTSEEDTVVVILVYIVRVILSRNVARISCGCQVKCDERQCDEDWNNEPIKERQLYQDSCDKNEDTSDEQDKIHDEHRWMPVIHHLTLLDSQELAKSASGECFINLREKTWYLNHQELMRPSYGCPPQARNMSKENHKSKSAKCEDADQKKLKDGHCHGAFLLWHFLVIHTRIDQSSQDQLSRPDDLSETDVVCITATI